MPRPLVIAFAIVVSLALAAQAVQPGDGPGGVGTTDGSSALELWVKADTLGLGNGAAVSTWNDASGNGRNLTQGSPALRPTFIVDALGNHPVVRFAADFFGPQTLPSTNNEFTIVAVMKPAVTGAYHNVMDGQGGARPMLWIDGLGNYEFNFTTGAVTPASGNNDVLFAIKRSTGPQFSQIYLNGPAVTASGPNAFNVAANQSYTLFNRSGGQAFSGDVAELIVYGTALTQPEINKVGYYLQEKYSLSTNFPPPFPVLTGYQQNPAVYGVGAPIPPNAPIVDGDTAIGFSISPTLPPGLLLDATTGVISGTPTAVASPTNYTLVATFAGQPNSSTQISIEVTAPSLTGYSRNPATFTRGRQANPIQPQLLGGPATGFTISPPLPAGLNLSSATGAISGTPTESAPVASYTVTAMFNGYPNSSHDLTLEVLEPSSTLDITEFMAINDSTIADGDGEFSDWIEINNYGSIAIDLEGWSLTDDPAELQKWSFPPRIIAPGSYLVVFASGDSHTDPAGNPHTNFKLEGGGEFLALVAPDGTTVARQFSPAYPAQTGDISYGTPDRMTFGTYSPATPARLTAPLPQSPRRSRYPRPDARFRVL